jgi:hypothetical protein
MSTSDWWKIDCNGVEIARGTWDEIEDILHAHVTRAMDRHAPLGLNIAIRRAQSIAPPQRQKTSGQAREMKIAHLLRKVDDDNGRDHVA